MDRAAIVRRQTDGKDAPLAEEIRPVPVMDARKRRAVFAWLIGFGALGVVVLIALRHGEAQQFTQLVTEAQPAWLLLAGALQVGTYVADAGIWQRVLARGGRNSPVQSFIGLGLAKLFIDQAVPTAGISGTTLIVLALDRRGVARETTMASVVLDIVSHYFAYALALAVGLVTLGLRGHLNDAMLAGAVVFGVGAISTSILLLMLAFGGAKKLRRFADRLPIAHSILRAIGDADTRLVRDTRLVVQCVALQLAIFLLDAATLAVLLLAIGVHAPAIEVFACFMVATLARTVGVIPGGLGTFDGVQVATLHMVGIPIAAALSATILFRGLSFWLPLIPGMWLARHEART